MSVKIRPLDESADSSEYTPPPPQAQSNIPLPPYVDYELRHLRTGWLNGLCPTITYDWHVKGVEDAVRLSIVEQTKVGPRHTEKCIVSHDLPGIYYDRWALVAPVSGSIASPRDSDNAVGNNVIGQMATLLTGMVRCYNYGVNACQCDNHPFVTDNDAGVDDEPPYPVSKLLEVTASLHDVISTLGKSDVANKVLYSDEFRDNIRTQLMMDVEPALYRTLRGAQCALPKGHPECTNKEEEHLVIKRHMFYSKWFAPFLLSWFGPTCDNTQLLKITARVIDILSLSDICAECSYATTTTAMGLLPGTFADSHETRAVIAACMFLYVYPLTTLHIGRAIDLPKPLQHKLEVATPTLHPEVKDALGYYINIHGKLPKLKEAAPWS